ncbi:MAG TPA: mechanosensitive ion channel family protein [Thermoanaerobaculia bacterium]|nr:mechanosensitive ion channel family protein [Thermoanaerobaculia bacterium]
MRILALLWFVLLAPPPVAAAQEPARDTAAVLVDGKVLFRVRGIEALPAARRAKDIASRITALAADRSFRPETLRVQERGEVTDILSGSLMVMRLTDMDASIEGVERPLLAPVYAERIRRAIAEHREERTRPRLAASLGRAVVAIGAVAVLLALLLWLLRRGQALLQSAFDRRVGVLLATESDRTLRVERLRQTLRSAVGVVRVVIVLLVAFFLLEYVLIQFPWTRGAGLRLSQSVAGPLNGLGEGFVAALPNLVILAILFFVTRFGLALVRLYFEAVQGGTIQLHNFEPEWAQLIYNLVRIVAIAFALVIAYPFIPGSKSEAFKGLSILAGLMLSLASSSAIANVIAGYMLVFRRAFRVGDRVKIGDILGAVTEMRLQVTHIRTIKNEEITLPNSVILGSEVLNYSKPAREGRLILHTEVDIGYGNPWRQVEALLIEAARHTPGLLEEPPPFVLQRELGDFAITYQINAYSDRADRMPATYADLHRNILDQFNEHGVQIMTPAYEGDPEKPKIVAKEQWFTAPARDAEGDGLSSGPTRST